jgi:Asp-tRNA(Asn)/Glu-tRNA(Gln) amidotransferase A subunit family amidase
VNIICKQFQDQTLFNIALSLEELFKN